jgi:osmotically-inducible protein OsmY
MQPEKCDQAPDAQPRTGASLYSSAAYNMLPKDNGNQMMENFTNIIKIVMCMLLLTSLLSCAGTSQRESTGQYVDDSAITAKVKARIFDEDSLKSMQITVVTFKGDVQLSGFVDSSHNVIKAGKIARNVAGVRSVKNDLVVK